MKLFISFILLITTMNAMDLKPWTTKIEQLSDEEKYVLINKGTQAPYVGKYTNEKSNGIYTCKICEAPLYKSSDKFDSGCGWPSFSKPIDNKTINEKRDMSHGMIRTEVRSRYGDSHLGHVFTDGPKDKGGLRYCINSASLRFIPLEDMEAEGYGEYLDQIIQKGETE